MIIYSTYQTILFSLATAMAFVFLIAIVRYLTRL